MTYRGRKKNGVVMLDDPDAIPDGTEVSIRAIKGTTRKNQAKRQPPTHYERYKHVIGKAKGLPPDLALNHDYYLHGLPKK